ncbi:MAG: hypothetical protein MRY49_03405 [Candidatus Pacebacteria bacterium]|nr:hypothetical protein [Candidatus Paceibacterota bacterium]
MSITNLKGKIKSISTDTKNSLFIVAVIIGVAFSAFALGRVSVGEDRSVDILYPQEVIERAREANIEAYVIASSKGSVYYYPWCPNSLSAANLIRFESSKEAENRGYRIASGCAGL